MKIQLNVRVIASEQKKFTITMSRSSNDKLMDLAQEIGDQLTQSKYNLTFIFKGENLDLSTRLGDK